MLLHTHACGCLRCCSSDSVLVCFLLLCSISLETLQPQANQMVDGHLLLPQDMVIKTDRKRKRFIRLLGCSLSLRDTNKGVQGRSLETGIKSRDHGGSSLLTGLLPGSCLASFHIQLWPTCVRLVYGPLCSPASIHSQENTPQI